MDYIRNTYNEFVGYAIETASTIHNRITRIYELEQPVPVAQEQPEQQTIFGSIFAFYNTIITSMHGVIDNALERFEQSFVNQTLPTKIRIGFPIIIIFILCTYTIFAYGLTIMVVTHKFLNVYSTNRFGNLFSWEFLTFGFAIFFIISFVGIVTNLALFFYACTATSFLYKIFFNNEPKTTYKKIFDGFLYMVGISMLLLNYTLVSYNRQIIRFLVTTTLGDLIGIPIYFVFLYSNVIMLLYMYGNIRNHFNPGAGDKYTKSWLLSQTTIAAIFIFSITIGILVNGLFFGSIINLVKSIFSIFYLSVSG